MQDASDNPFVAFVSERITYFASESLRLRDKGVLVEYKKLVDTLFSVHQKLGTVEHEVALADLSAEYKKAGPEAAQAWREIWRRFSEQREGARALERKVQKIDIEAESHIRDIEKSREHREAGDEELATSMRDVLDSMKQADAAGKRLSKGLWKGPWLFLWINLRIYSVFVRYFAARLTFVALRHSFIIIVSILIFGITYSKVAAALTNTIAGLATAWPWLAGTLVVGAYLLKKYYIDAKVKKLQVRLEARWLSGVALHMHMVRTFALMSRMQSRKSAGEA